jgi:ATP-binding cassette subfamily F protein uup
MLGLLEPDRGKVDTGETVSVSYIDQTRDDLDPHETVLRAIAGDHTSVKIGTRLVRIESFLGRFLFDAAQFRTPVGKLSGGERNRVLLAKLLLQGGNVLVLDEPTNDLDLMTLRVLEEALVAFPGAALVVSHDRFFLDRVATRLVYLDGHGHVREWPGDMTGLLEQLKDEQAARKRKTRDREKPPREKPRGPRKRSYHEQRELDALPGRIAKLEEEIEALDGKLADPDFYKRPDVAEITARRKEAADELDALFARWVELEED